MALLTYPLNGITYDATDAEAYLCTRTSGVYSAENNFQISITGNREVTIGNGIAWIRNTDFAGKVVVAKTATALTVAAANGSNPRYDLVVIEFNATTLTSVLKIVQGTPSASPSVPAVSKTASIYQLALYKILVPAASTTIQSSHITNTMTDENLCGLMRDGVTAIPTQTLHNQYTQVLEQLQAELASIVDRSGFVMRTDTDLLVSTYTHSKSGTVHNFVGSGTNGRVKMTANVAAGDTVQINGASATAYYGTEAFTNLAGEAVSGKWLTFTREGSTLNFKGGGGISAAKLAATTATAATVLSPYTFYSKNKELKTGTIASKGATTYRASTSDQTIASGQYLSGAQTIKAVTQTNLSAANIVSGTTVTIASNGTNLYSVAGTAQKKWTIVGLAWGGSRDTDSKSSEDNRSKNVTSDVDIVVRLRENNKLYTIVTTFKTAGVYRVMLYNVYTETNTFAGKHTANNQEVSCAANTTTTVTCNGSWVQDFCLIVVKIG